MIVRVDKCEKCGEDVVIVMPDLFPDLTQDKLVKFKELSMRPAYMFCKNCKERK